jgi:hypothetical protein
MSKQTNTLRPSPKGFQSPKFSDSDFREVRGLGLGLGPPKSSSYIHLKIVVKPLTIVAPSLRRMDK